MPLPPPADDRTAIVTGASAGIGVELARQLAAKGHGLTLVARREERLHVLARELREAHGVRVEVVPTDLADSVARSALVDEVTSRGLEVDILVNNAGFSTIGAVFRSDPEREVAMVRTNVEAVVHLCSLVVPGMVERRRGRVLNVASTAAFQPLPGQSGYGGSKAFVLSYTQAMSIELKHTGVSATALCPGPVETEFAEAAGLAPEEAGKALPQVMWVAAADVATAGIEGLAAGRPVVIPGATNRAVASLAKVIPRRLLLPVLAKRHPSL